MQQDTTLPKEGYCCFSLKVKEYSKENFRLDNDSIPVETCWQVSKWFVSSDVKMNGTWHFKIIEKKGTEYFIIEKETIDVEVAGKISIQLEDLFRGNPQLTKNINNAINENIDALYNDFKPLLTTTLSTVSRSYFNRVFELFPYDVLLPR
ncbi:hemolymph juvenile hormone binding protein (JHBP) [Popillia japonica]|uniref:Hemolymph juvenile hormone binding protein (JHBP) n=1 Tax=Popillia japonica TaxID=7064 RepID=A0AAW1JYL4_POPJA